MEGHANAEKQKVGGNGKKKRKKRKEKKEKRIDKTIKTKTSCFGYFFFEDA